MAATLLNVVAVSYGCIESTSFHIKKPWAQLNVLSILKAVYAERESEAAISKKGVLQEVNEGCVATAYRALDGCSAIAHVDKFS